MRASSNLYKEFCYIAGVFPATANPLIGYFMVTWHPTMKLFPAKCHERATLRKLWRETGKSSLLPAKCWPLLHVIAGISERFSNFAFALFCYITNHLMTGPLGNSEFCFPRISMFSSLETLRFSGNKFHCFPRDHSLSAKCLGEMLTHFLNLTNRPQINRILTFTKELQQW